MLLSAIGRRRSADLDQSRWHRRLRARDICWGLDVFFDDLPAPDRLRLAREAVQLDDDFSGAAARLARVAVVAGNVDEARTAAARALALAAPVQRCADPLFEALASEIVVECWALVWSAAAEPRWRPDPMRSRCTRRERERAGQGLDRMRAAWARCRELDPIWCDRVGGRAQLRAMIDAVRASLDRPGVERRRGRASLAQVAEAHDD